MANNEISNVVKNGLVAGSAGVLGSLAGCSGGIALGFLAGGPVGAALGWGIGFVAGGTGSTIAATKIKKKLEEK